MKSSALFFFLIVFILKLSAQKEDDQYKAIDQKALQIPDSLSWSSAKIASYMKENFIGEESISRAVFAWVATNIEYDVKNMFEINLHEKKEDKILKPLKTRKGICENYAALYDDICSKAGLNSVVIEGFTKQNGRTDYLPHAWCAVMIDSVWYLIDPTWGAGYVTDGIYYQKLNNEYYKARPEWYIKTHQPFDYQWQLLHNIVSNQEFIDDHPKENTEKAFYHYEDTIRSYQKLDHIDQLRSAAFRVGKNGIVNSMVFEYLKNIKLEIENDHQMKVAELYNSAVTDFNDGVIALNEFIQYRNKQFMPSKPDNEIQGMVDFAVNKLAQADEKLNRITAADENVINMIRQMTKTMNDASKNMKEQQDFLKSYFKKNKVDRKSMFYEKRIVRY